VTKEQPQRNPPTPDTGQVVGSYDLAGANHGFLFSGGSFVTLDFPGAFATFPSGINNLGQISGFYFDSNFFGHGFLLGPGGFSEVDVPAALDTFAKGVNNRGTFCGFYDFGGASQGFCAQAIPEPGILGLFLVGVFSLCCARWIRNIGLLNLRREGENVKPLRASTWLSLLLMAVVLLPALARAQGQPLNFIYPADGEFVGGPNLMLWASSDGVQPINVAVIFEVSLDGQNFLILPREDAPDYGPGSFTTSVDTTALPVGTVFFRARFETDSTGPLISVQVRRPPAPSCKVTRFSSLSVMFDCSASQDSNGGITSYAFDFGDGTAPVTTSSPSVTHFYPKLGYYPVSFTTTDAIGLSTTLYKQLTLVQLALLQNRPKTCGCASMTVSRGGNSTLVDLRRRMRGALGPDDTFVSFNFEVSAMLAAGSDPSLCMEGQEIRRTSTVTIAGGAQPPTHKRACSAGRMPLLPSCTNDRQCDNMTCNGGALNGQTCNTTAAALRCQVGAGMCVSVNPPDGRCTTYPFDGANGPRGTDDYRAPLPDDAAVKLHLPNGTPIWLDLAGLPDNTRAMAVTARTDLRYDADFLAFVRGPGGNCSCHFTVVLDFDSSNPNGQRPTGQYRAATGLTLVNDADTMRCSVNPR
jgi:PKD repeat protein